RPRNTASIGKRMKNMWIPFPGIHIAFPGASVDRPIRPMNRAQNERAWSTSCARTVRRVSLIAPGPRPGAVISSAGSDGQVLHDQDQGRPQDDHEQRREDAPDEREQHLDRRLRGLLLGALPA